MCIISVFKCGKLLFLYFNILFVFYTFLYSGQSKTGHSGNKIIRTRRTSAADGLSLATIWHTHFGKKVCDFLVASYCAVARYFWSRTINNTFLHLSLSLFLSLSILNQVISSMKKCVLQNYRRRSSYKFKRKKQCRKQFHSSGFFSNKSCFTELETLISNVLNLMTISCKQIRNFSIRSNQNILFCKVFFIVMVCMHIAGSRNPA